VPPTARESSAHNWASYNESAQTYDAVAVRHYFLPAARQLIDFAQLSAGQRILDVGSGTGAVARAALRTVPRASVIAVDLSMPMLLCGRDAGVRRSVVSTVLHLPFPERSFDCVTAGFVLNHVANCEAAITETRRVLRDGGKCAVTSWATGPSDNAVGQAWTAIAGRYVNVEILRTASESALPSEARLSNLEVLSTIVRGVGLNILLARQVQFPTTMSTHDYLDARCGGMAGRFIRTLLDMDSWSRFVQDARTALSQAFDDAVTFVVSVNFVVAQKGRMD
jgi:ubiquinone/menaquinone biosynthesis C-methylase UbiE